MPGFSEQEICQVARYTAGFNLISRYLASSPNLKASMPNINAEELKDFI
jgi:uncharacterized protein YjaZ